MEVSLAQALAAKVSDIITNAAKSSPGCRPRPGQEAGRPARAAEVAPKYEVMDEYGFVIWDEAMTILDRILVYPFTANIEST